MKNDHSGAENPDLVQGPAHWPADRRGQVSAQEPGGGDHRSLLVLCYLCPLGHAPPGSESRFPHLYGKLTLVDHFDNGSYIWYRKETHVGMAF